MRNCRQESNTIVLQSGRYHETAGFVSVAFPERHLESHNAFRPLGAPSFSRRYIDLNPLNLAHHLGLSLRNTSLATPFGHYVRHIVHSLAAKWKLDDVHGFAPQDWYLERYDANDERSVLRGTRDVLARVFRKTHEIAGEDQQMRVVLINSGSLRNDLKKGPCESLTQVLLRGKDQMADHTGLSWLSPLSSQSPTAISSSSRPSQIRYVPSGNQSRQSRATG